MWYVYVLVGNKDSWHYYGFTKDLKKRYEQHITGQVAATRNYRPLQLKYYEAYDNERLARKRERTLKSSRSATKALAERLDI